MTVESRFDSAISRLIADGYFQKQSDFASAIGENASGLTSIKRGVKRLRIEHIEKLKKVVPDFNTDWLLTGKGEVYQKEEVTQNIVAEPQSTYVPGKRDISSLLEDIESRLDPEGRKLVRHLKVEIDEIIKDKDATKEKVIKLQDRLIEVQEILEGKK